MAVRPSAFGELVVMLLKMLMSTRKSVMSSAMRPEMAYIKLREQASPTHTVHTLLKTTTHATFDLLFGPADFLPGTMSGGIRNEIHETTTNSPEGR